MSFRPKWRNLAKRKGDIMKIVYTHHAQRDVSGGINQENGLTEFGVQEATIIGEMLKTVPVKVIYIGEYVRYKLTAELINKYIQAPIVVDKRLNERNAEDKKAENSFENRTHDFLNEIIKNHDNNDVIFCVTSGGNLDPFISYFYKGKIEGFIRMQAIGVSPVNFEFDKEGNDDYDPVTNWVNFTNKNFGGGKT